MDGCRGYSLAPYRDYRGLPVVGAWTWLPEYGFGIITELDADEAFRPLTVLRIVFGGLVIALAGALVGVLLYVRINAALKRRFSKVKERVQELGQYRLQEKLGAGGMGEVYVGYHALMRRPTAIKLLRQVDELSLARFEREVKLTCQLCHPNTIAIYDYGRTADGVFYYAMELLEGLDLEAVINVEGTLPLERVIHILKQACGSLAEAHDMGLVHRDIKPANIFLTRRGGIHDFVKVLDFGLVKSVASVTANVTEANAIAGTPNYMSPEMVGRQGKIDHRTDLYALGCIAFFLLSGRCIFEKDAVVSVLMAHLNEPAPSLADLGVHVPAEMEAVIATCLAKSPSDRYPDARSLAAALDAVPGAGEWTEARAAECWTRARDAIRKVVTEPSGPDVLGPPLKTTTVL
jgi:serine/threonine protein kinase